MLNTPALHFVQFWLDTIKEWEKETGKYAIIALSTTKDVQDAILADKERASVVDVIDIRYWHYQADGKTYEPKGGQNLAPRQHARLLKPKASSFEQVYRAVAEYRQKYPEKAVMYSGDGFDANGWAVLMAGGSLPAVPTLSKEFLNAASSMKLVSLPGLSPNQYALSNNQSYIIYNASSNEVQLDLAKGSYVIHRINPKTGSNHNETVKNGGKISLKNSTSNPEVLWISKQ